MKVLGVDPGYDRMGVAIMEHGTRGSLEHFVYSSCIKTDKQTDLSERYLVLGNAFEKLLLEHSPDAVAVETLFFNKNLKTALAVAHARGVIMYLAKIHGAKIYEFGPQEIKVAVTGYGKSDKAAVIDMTKRLVANAPKEALDDEYDAIAVALTCLSHHRN